MIGPWKTTFLDVHPWKSKRFRTCIYIHHCDLSHQKKVGTGHGTMKQFLSSFLVVPSMFFAWWYPRYIWYHLIGSKRMIDDTPHIPMFSCESSILASGIYFLDDKTDDFSTSSWFLSFWSWSCQFCLLHFQKITTFTTCHRRSVSSPPRGPRCGACAAPNWPRLFDTNFKG